MDTLDLLVECLQQYNGTLIVVSHDRDFLDRTVTSTYVVSETGEVQEYVGGYSDIEHYLKAASKASIKEKPKAAQTEKISAPPKRLSYNLKREWEELPKAIKALEKRIEELSTHLEDVTLYEKNPHQFAALSEELQECQEGLDAAETRWLELEMMAEKIQK
jgi:ATP-binding cassette subfamily F protein uup